MSDPQRSLEDELMGLVEEVQDLLEGDSNLSGAAADLVGGIPDLSTHDMRGRTWAEPGSIEIVRKGGIDYYRFPSGEYPRVTAVEKVLGLSKDGLINWSANTERAGCLAAVEAVYKRETQRHAPHAFRALVESEIGPAKKHIKALGDAADIGTMVHDHIFDRTASMLGGASQPPKELPDAALVSVMAWEDWWKGAGITPLRIEQPVCDEEWGFAGTIDLVCMDAGGPLIVDYKTSKYLYLDHHIQVSAYMKATGINRAKLVRLPKNISDPAFEVVEVGQCVEYVWGKRKEFRIEPERLMEAFYHSLQAWKLLIERREA